MKIGTNVIQFKSELSKSLLQLPGVAAQFQMAPSHRIGPYHHIHPPMDAKKAGVLVLLYPHKKELHFLMMKRVADSGPHSKQISFPGGRFERHDKNLIQTALRESFEEMGIEPDLVEVLGVLTQLYIQPSNFLVQPVLGWAKSRPDMKLESKEVEESLEIPLSMLLDLKKRKVRPMKIREHFIPVPYFDFNESIIWGASAMILSELFQIFKNFPQKMLAKSDF